MGWRDSWNRMVDSVSGNHDEYDDEYMDDDEEYEDDRILSVTLKKLPII